MSLLNLVALVFLILIAIIPVAIARNLIFSKRCLAPRGLTLIVVLICYPISGIVHLSTNEYYRGYFDLLKNSLISNHETTLILTVLTCSVSVVAFCIGARVWKPNMVAMTSNQVTIPKWMPIYASMVLIFGLVASLLIYETLRGTDAVRVIELQGGLARYAPISHWMAWGLTLISLTLLNWLRASQAMTLLIVLVTVLLIFISVRWTGGRTIGFVFSLPLILLTVDRIGKLKWPFFIAIGLGITTYAIYISQIRRIGFANEQVSLFEILDWEFGRFSMLGFAIDFTDSNGYLFGETILGSFEKLTEGIGKLFRLDLPASSYMMTQYTGEMILGSSDSTYIVPGLSAELYMNFGLLSIAIGYYLIGRACTHIERKSMQTTNVSKKLFFTYLGVILSLCLINAHSFSFLSYLVYSGAPLLALLLLDRNNQGMANT